MIIKRSKPSIMNHSTTSKNEHEAHDGKVPIMAKDQSQDKANDEPQNEETGKGGQRDLLAEALDKWETFKANQRQLPEQQENQK